MHTLTNNGNSVTVYGEEIELGLIRAGSTISIKEGR